MEFCRETDLEQHVFHHVAGVFLRQAELPLALGFERQVLVGMAEQHVIEAPLRRRQDAGNAHLATQGDIRQAHSTAGGIPRRPGFARTGIGCMAIGTQRLAIDKGLGQCRQQLLAIGPHQLGAHCGGSHFHQQHMIEADTVEGVFQGNHALNLMGHDHGLEHIIHGQRCFAIGHALL